MIGILVSKALVDSVLGGVCRQIHNDFNDVAVLKAWSDRTPQEDIEALGYSADDAYLIKLIIDELDQFRSIFTGAANLANAKDFRVQSQKAIGLGR